MILVNGDSVTYGQGLTSAEITWPTLLLNDVINIAEPGSSNESISRRTIEQIILNKNINMVIIGWSTLYRLELGDKFSKPKTIVTSCARTIIEKELATDWLGEYWFFKKFLLNLYNVKNITKQKNIDFYCVNFGIDTAKMFLKIETYKTFKQLFNLDKWADKEIHKEFVLINRLANYCNDCWLIDPKIDITTAYLTKNEVISAQDYHPNQQGHITIANFIRKNTNILL